LFRYGDIDYFRQQLDFTWDPIRFKGLPEYVDWLHTQGMKFITILDPAIDSEEPNYDVFSEGQKADIWIKWPERRNIQFNETKNRNLVGYVWPYGWIILVELVLITISSFHFRQISIS
jgi:alpha-glucosidase (family GH31 glycosyl hydrolase)